MDAPKKFSIPLFLIGVAVQYCALLMLFRLALPQLWDVQLRAGPLAFVIVLSGGQVVDCFFEWFFHRYVLHRVVWRPLRGLATAHRLHHALTPIKVEPNDVGPDRIILNRYPILDQERFESSAFPVYALAVFWLVFTPLFVGLQLLLPHAPILLGGYTAVTWSMVSYEVFHAVEHFDYEWWKSATEHPTFGGMWRKIYGFHHFHHANVSANEAISGFFFGLPLADWCFGTYHQPQGLLLGGRIATAQLFAVRPPRRIVQWMDRWAKRREGSIIHG